MSFELDVKKTVKKSNMLNELRNANTSMAEYRLFCVYLAHVPMNSDNNEVTFKLADYARIVGLDRPRKEDIELQAHNIVSRTAQIDDVETGGFEVVPIFQRFKLTHETDGWYVTLACNNDIAPMIREQKGKFLRYKLYNTIYLKSYNQQRIYELLKQYERVGVRVIELDDLREYLSISKNEYPVWGDFSQKVLKVAQKALKENTDIYFDYEPIKKGRPVVAVRFNIYKNDAFIDQLRIDEFLPDAAIEEGYEGEEIDICSEESKNQVSIFDVLDEDEAEKRSKICSGFEDEIFAEFTLAQLDELRSLAWHNVTQEDVDRHMNNGYLTPYEAQQQAVADYIIRKIKMTNAKGDAIEKRYGFIKKAVAEDYQ